MTIISDKNPSYRPRIAVCSAVAFFCLGVLAVTTHAETPVSSALPDAFAPDQLLWEISLGSHQYTVPVVHEDRLYIGVNDLGLEHPAATSTGGGILMCLDKASGRQIWQMPIPRNMSGRIEPFHFNHWKCGVCSQPTFDGDRLFIVGPRGDILCLDRDGQTDGNDGPFRDELQYMEISESAGYQLGANDGDIVWQYDMIKEAGVVPHDVCGSCPVVYGDYVYVCTSNGVDGKHQDVANPDAPSLIALDKNTGRLAAVDGAEIGERILHGQWSSPVIAEFGGRPRLLFGGGDGVLYAFEPLSDTSDEVRRMKPLWSYDCCPPDYREQAGQPIPYGRWNKKRTDGPSEIIPTPIVYRDRIYVSIGQSPVHGPGRGVLSCIDGVTGRRVWESRKVNRTLSDVAIHEGLLYISDYSGLLHCLDAETGEEVWDHDLDGGVWCASPVVMNDRVYISNERMRFWVFKTGREKTVLSSSRVHSMAITPVVDGDVLYLPTQRRLFAVKVE